jgi:hypothetical protein
MAKRRTTSKDLSDSVRDAVERTVQATLGSAQQTRETVEDAFREAEKGLQRNRPATQKDLDELRAELRAIGRRLDAIEGRLPKTRAPAKKRTPAKKRAVE